MWKKLPELLINGASLYLVGRELADSFKGRDELSQAYEELRLGREEIRELHVRFLEIMGQILELEQDRSAAYRQYLQLVDQIEALGYRVSEVGDIIEPEHDAEAQALDDILGDEDEEF